MGEIVREIFVFVFDYPCIITMNQYKCIYDVNTFTCNAFSKLSRLQKKQRRRRSRRNTSRATLGDDVVGGVNDETLSFVVVV